MGLGKYSMLGTGFDLDIVSWSNYVLNTYDSMDANDKAIFDAMLSDNGFVLSGKLDKGKLISWATSYITSTHCPSMGFPNRFINPIQ